MTKDAIPLYKYCPRTKYGLTTQDLIKFVVDVEDQLNEVYKPASLPKYEKVDIKWTPASIRGMAGNCVKFIWDLRP